MRCRRPRVSSCRGEGVGWDLHENGQVLFVLPSAFGLPGAGDYLRLHQTFEHGLRIFAQFQLGEPGCRAGDAFPGYGHIVLPQPEPREWQAYSPSDRPAERNTSYPYWLIEQSEFFKA